MAIYIDHTKEPDSEDVEIEKLESLILWDSRIESLLEELLEEQKITNKLLKKIYNPE